MSEGGRDLVDGAYYRVLWRWATGLQEWRPLRWRGGSYLPGWPGGWDHGFGHAFRADLAPDPAHGGPVEIGERIPMPGDEPADPARFDFLDAWNAAKVVGADYLEVRFGEHVMKAERRGGVETVDDVAPWPVRGKASG